MPRQAGITLFIPPGRYASDPSGVKSGPAGRGWGLGMVVLSISRFVFYLSPV
jgi:hypothetical protein